MLLNSVDGLTNKLLEMHGCVLCTVAIDALVLKHRAISIPSADYTVLEQFCTEMLHI